jgi:hypothetical protein
MDSTYKSLNDKGKQYFLAAAVGGGIIMSLGFLVMMGGIMSKDAKGDKNMGMIFGGFFMFAAGMISLICAYKIIGVKAQYKASYCEHDADCGTSNVCVSNSCTGPSYAPAGCDKTNNCPIQSYCSKDVDCDSGYCSNNKCLVLPCIATKDCQKDTVCTDGSICASGICTAGLCTTSQNQVPTTGTTGTGPTCSATSCVNGTCVNGTCTCMTGYNMVNGICTAAVPVQTPVVQTPVVSTSGPTWPPDGNLTGYISSTLPPNTTRTLEYKAANNLDAALLQLSKWGKTSELGTLVGDTTCFTAGRQIAISSDGSFWATSYSPGTKYPSSILPSTMFYQGTAPEGYGVPSETCASNGLPPN